MFAGLIFLKEVLVNFIGMNNLSSLFIFKLFFNLDSLVLDSFLHDHVWEDTCGLLLHHNRSLWGYLSHFKFEFSLIIIKVLN